jgi:hypothetical protein
MLPWGIEKEHLMYRSVLVRAPICAMLAIVFIAGPGCSAFQPRMQAITITATQPGADIYVDGNNLGKSPVTTELARDRSHSVMAKYGSKSGVTTIEKKISGTGVLDLVGTFLFLVPAIGLFTPGFWELDPTNVNVAVN